MWKLWVCVFVLFLGGCISVKGLVGSGSSPLQEQVVSGEGRAKLVVIDISGILALGRIGPEFLNRQPPLMARVREELDLARRDSRVAGFLIRIDSSGGSVTASDILYHEIWELARARQIPVVALVLDKALSGGYYVALAADEIFAHPTSMVGGVGVIAFKFNVAQLMAKWGIENESVKSGELKDFWSPLRANTPEETALMQGITDRLHQRFLDLVAERRGLKECTLKQVGKGTVFDGVPARALGLVDAIGYFEDALQRLRQLAGVSEAQVIIYRRPDAYAENIYAASGPMLRETIQLERITTELLEPSFRYQVLP